MGLRDVQELVDALEGMPAGACIGPDASRLTIGDLRLLLHCATEMIADHRRPDSTTLPERAHTSLPAAF